MDSGRCCEGDLGVCVERVFGDVIRACADEVDEDEIWSVMLRILGQDE